MYLQLWNRGNWQVQQATERCPRKGTATGTSRSYHQTGTADSSRRIYSQHFVQKKSPARLVNRVITRTNSYISPTANPFYYRISKTNTWILNFNMNLHFKTLNYPAKRTWMWKKAISSIISLNLKVLIYFNKSRCPYARKLTSKNVKYAQYHLKAFGVLCIFKIA